MPTQDQRRKAVNDFMLEHYNGRITFFEAMEGYAEWLAINEELGEPIGVQMQPPIGKKLVDHVER